MFYWVHLAISGVRTHTFVVIGTDCTRSFKYKHHTITTPDNPLIFSILETRICGPSSLLKVSDSPDITRWCSWRMFVLCKQETVFCLLTVVPTGVTQSEYQGASSKSGQKVKSTKYENTTFKEHNQYSHILQTHCCHITTIVYITDISLLSFSESVIHMSNFV